jgi:phage gp16-like protein
MAAIKQDERSRLIKLIHVGRRELGMDDESYRAMLSNIPRLEGATSSKDLSVPNLKVVLEVLKSKGFKVVPNPKKAAITTQNSKKATITTSKTDKKMADDAQSKLIRHLWLELHNKGAVRDPSETALTRFVANRVQVEALQWLSTAQASRVIEHLKKWLKRANS